MKQYFIPNLSFKTIKDIKDNLFSLKIIYQYLMMFINQLLMKMKKINICFLSLKIVK